MAYWHMTKKVLGHPELGAEENVLHACYGLSANFVSMANVAANSRTIMVGRTGDVSSLELWTTDFAGEEGLAAPLTKTGVLVLTDQRLLYFEKALAIGKPKKILATWPLRQLTAISYDDKTLRIRFSDGSIGGLHVPKAQQPRKFLDAFAELVQ